MSDVQARVTELAAKAIHNVPGIECDHIDGKQPTCERDAAHVAAVLAEAGLLVDPDATVRQDGLTLRDLNAAYDRQRQELAEAHEREDAARAELAEWRKVAGVSTPDEMRQDNADIGKALEAAADWKARAEGAEAAERRGAVAALREAADRLDEMDEPWPDRPRLHQHHAEWLRDRAAHIEKGAGA